MSPNIDRKPIHTEYYRFQYGEFTGPPEPRRIVCKLCNKSAAVDRTHGCRKYCNECRNPLTGGARRWRKSSDGGRCALYRHWDANGCLLYVGISINPFNRTQDHRHTSGWFYDVATITVEFFETTREAMKAELVAIRKERPKHNKAGVVSFGSAA